MVFSRTGAAPGILLPASPCCTGKFQFSSRHLALLFNFAQITAPPDPPMRISNAFPILFVSLLCLPLGWSCGRSKERIIRDTVAERVAEFRKKEREKCRQTLLVEAGKAVDSLLLYEALDEVNDSLARLRPFRPVKPVNIPPIDTSAVKPIFDH